MAWGLELDSSSVEVRRVMQEIAPTEYLGNLESLLEWDILGRGFEVSEGILEFHQELRGRYISFLRQREAMKARFRETVGRGWEALKIFAQIMELEEVIRQAREEPGDEDVSGQRLNPRTRRMKVDMARKNATLAIFPSSSL